MNIAPNGTWVARTDVYGGWVYNSANTLWTNIANSVSMPSLNAVGGQLGVFEIVVAPSNSQIIYTIWKGNLLKSSNQGQTFSTTPTVLKGPAESNNSTYKTNQQKIAVDPNNANKLIVAFQTPNPWSAVTTYAVGNLGSGSQLVFANDGLIYISIQTGNLNHDPSGGANPTWWTLVGPSMTRTADGGTTWTTITGIPQVTGGICGICYVNSSTVLAISPGNGLFVSTDAGATWAPVSGSPAFGIAGCVDSAGVYYMLSGPASGASGTKIYRVPAPYSTASLIYTGTNLASITTQTNSSPVAGSVWIAVGVRSGGVVIALNGQNASPTFVSAAGWNWSDTGFNSSSDPAPNTGRGGAPILFDPTSVGKLLWGSSVGVYQSTSVTSAFSAATTIAWVSNYDGIENNVGNDPEPTSNGGVLLTAWDHGGTVNTAANTYPTSTLPNINGSIRIGSNADYASSDKTYMVACVGSGYQSPAIEESMYSHTNGQAPSTWTHFIQDNGGQTPPTYTPTIAIGATTIPLTAVVPSWVKVGMYVYFPATANACSNFQKVTSLGASSIGIAPGLDLALPDNSVGHGNGAGNKVFFSNKSVPLNTNFTAVGSSQGQLGGIIAASTPNNLVWWPAAVVSRPWYTTDGGVTWTQSLPANFSPAEPTWTSGTLTGNGAYHKCLTAERDTTQPGLFYVFIVNSGVWMTTNGGVSWSLQANNVALGATALVNISATNLFSVPGFPNHVWISTYNSGRMGFTTNIKTAAAAWTVITGWSVINTIGVGIKMTGATYATIFAVGKRSILTDGVPAGTYGAWYSTDRGVTWKAMGNPMLGYGRGRPGGTFDSTAQIMGSHTNPNVAWCSASGGSLFWATYQP